MDTPSTPGARAAPTAPGAPLSPLRLAAAPHRLMFFVGASNVLLAMGWWAAWMVAMRWQAFDMPQPRPWAGWLHAFVMQYQMLPSFIFGFLLTTFPKWMGLPDLPRRAYLPVGVGLFGGQLATLAGALGVRWGIEAGLWLTLAGWSAGLLALGSLLVRDTGATWHARACFAALAVGFAGLVAWAGFIHGQPPTWAFASIKAGTFGLLLPVYLTVAHRMFPFFASRVVPGYVPWRPMWLLAALLGLCVAHLALELRHAYAWLWTADLPLLALSLVVLWRWWPGGRVPGLLVVLFIGLAWLPVTFALYAAQSLAYLATSEFILGRAPAHALFVGFFGSVLVSMVTRVVQGHSGRPLAMPATAWFAFVAIQAVALARLAAEVVPDGMAWQAAAATGWVLAFLPWVVRIGRITMAPRIDGKAG